MSNVSSGGGATIKGIMYQLLWSLLHASKLRIKEISNDNSPTATPLHATLVLEPRGGGGDLQLQASNERIIEQLKARSDHSTWSLRSVIEDVLPDLFLAIDDSPTKTRYRFVTEGTMGGWKNVYTSYFRNLGVRRTSAQNLLSLLDDSRKLKIQSKVAKGATPYFPLHCTERSLFCFIADRIRMRPSVGALNLDDPTLHNRLWQLLANFEFVGLQTEQRVQASIDSILLAIVDSQESIPQVRDHLTVALAKLATKGSAEIDADEFFASHGLSASPLSDWVAHRENAAVALRRKLDRLGYRAERDVRTADLPTLPPNGQVLIVTGASGLGKTWTLYALAMDATAGTRIPLLVEFDGTGEATLARAAELFWHEIHDGDIAISLARAAKRLKTVTRGKDAGFVVLVDAVRSFKDARYLVTQDWANWASALVIACDEDTAKALERAFPNTVTVQTCQRFTWEQLHSLLDRELDYPWASVPDDVRDILRTPLLAGLYFEELSDEQWLPTNEYELFDRIWKRLSTGVNAEHRLDSIRIEQLARSVRLGSKYPWTLRDLSDCRLDDLAIARIAQLGWMSTPDGEHYRIPHDRLLNWAVARSLLSDHAAGQLTAGELTEFVVAQAKGDRPVGSVNLGYVPMDVLWMVATRGSQCEQVASAILASLEEFDVRYTELLYGDLVPTLGECIASALLSRYRDGDHAPWILRRIRDAISKVAGSRAIEAAKSLLASDDAELRRRGACLLTVVPGNDALDLLWSYHKESQANPAAFDEEHGHFLYEESFGALKRAVRLNPRWLAERIAAADPTAEPVHDLAYLCANVDDGGGLWRECKAMLFAKVPQEKPRCLVANILTYRDEESSAWLDQWIGKTVDFVGSSALLAMSRIDADASVRALGRIEANDLGMCAHWCFSEVKERRHQESMSTLFALMQMTEDPWRYRQALDGSENDIAPAQLEFLLSDLEVRLRRKLSGEADSPSHFSPEFDFLSSLAAPDLIAVIRGRAGTSFESTLRDYVLSIGPHYGQYATGHERDPAMALLHMIGGGGLTAVVNSFLECTDRFGLHDAIRWADRRPDAVTIQLLSRISMSDDLWGKDSDKRKHPINQNEALQVLAKHGMWQDVSRGVQRLEMQTTPYLCRPTERIQGEWLDSLRDIAAATPSVGSVLAIGAVGSLEDCEFVRSVLESCDENSVLAHACIIALHDLGDESDDGVRLVVPHLRVQRHRFSAVRMLSQAGSPAAWNALLEDLRNEFDVISALNLINLSQHADEALTIALGSLRQERLSGASTLRVLVKGVRSEEMRQKVLNDPFVREFLHRSRRNREQFLGNGIENRYDRVLGRV